MGTVYNKMGGSVSGTINITANGTYDVKKYATANVSTNAPSAVQDFPLKFSNIPADGQVNQVVTISGNIILSYGLISMVAKNVTANENRILVVVNLEQLSNTQINVKCSGTGWGHSNTVCDLTLRVWYK